MPKLDLTGVVGDDIRSSDLSAFLDRHAAEPVELRLNSPGGSAFVGIEMFNAIRDHGDVTVTVEALAASAASLLCMGAKRIDMKPGALMMMHRASAMTLGNSEAHRRTTAVLDKIDARVVEIYAARSRLSRSKIESLLDAETWLSGEEAVAAGFADHAEVATFETKGASACAPNFKVDIRNLYRNPPQQLFALMAQTREPPMTTPNNQPDVTADLYARCTSANLTLQEANAIVLAAAGDATKGRDLIIDAVAKKAGDQSTVPGNGDGLAAPDALAKAVGDVIYARMSGKPVPEGQARDLAGRSLLDLGALMIQSTGGTIRSWHKDRLADQIMLSGGMHSTSDFPFLTQQSGNRLLGEAYEAAASALKKVARRRSSQDFRAIAVGRLGEMPQLLEVAEGGEVTYGTRTEASESFRLRTFARIFAITRQALVNDDLGAFADSVRAWGQAAAAVEANELYSLVSGNGAVMADGQTLWHSTHGNVAGSPSQLNVSSLDEARAAIRTTKGLDGVTPLNLSPRYLVVGPANETRAQVLVNASVSFTATEIENANPFASTLELLVEPRIEDYAFMLFADPASADVISYAYLGDRAGPELETRPGWSVLGLETRAIFDVGAGATGFRGAFKNAGASPEE